MLKILLKRGEIAPKEQFLLLSTIFCYLMSDFYVKTRIRFCHRDKWLFEIIEIEITRVDLFSCCSHWSDCLHLEFSFSSEQLLSSTNSDNLSLSQFADSVENKYCEDLQLSQSFSDMLSDIPEFNFDINFELQKWTWIGTSGQLWSKARRFWVRSLCHFCGQQ